MGKVVNEKENTSTGNIEEEGKNTHVLPLIVSQKGNRSLSAPSNLPESPASIFEALSTNYSQSNLPYSHTEYINDGRILVIFIEIKKLFTFKINTEVLRDKVLVDMKNGDIGRIRVHGKFTQRGDFLSEVFKDIIPNHIILCNQNSKMCARSQGKKKKKKKHPFITH